MANIITLNMLIKKITRSRQIGLFKQYFGESVKTTDDIRLKYSSEFEIGRLVDITLNEKQRELYYTIQAPARKEYETAIAAAWRKYEAWGETVNEAYPVRWNPPMAVYEAIGAAAEKEYEAAKKSAHKAYERKQANAFCIAYNS